MEDNQSVKGMAPVMQQGPTRLISGSRSHSMETFSESVQEYPWHGPVLGAGPRDRGRWRGVFHPTRRCPTREGNTGKSNRSTELYAKQTIKVEWAFNMAKYLFLTILFHTSSKDLRTTYTVPPMITPWQLGMAGRHWLTHGHPVNFMAVREFEIWFPQS